MAIAEPRRLPAGEWLYREGDPGDSMYVVLSGSLEVVSEQPEEAVLRVLGRGDVVGEIALLTKSPRSAAVRARRDTFLMKVPCDGFERLLTESPDFTLAMTRRIGRQLQETRAPAVVASPRPSTIAVVGGDEGLVAALHAALGGDAAILHEPEGGAPDGFGPKLEQCEQGYEQVLLAAAQPGEGGGAWTEFALRSADRIVLVTAAESPPDRSLDRRLGGCDLAFTGPAPARAAWLEALAPRAVHNLPGGSGDGAAAARLGRRLAGRAVGVVLSGGGARGFAHLGVLQELEAAGIEIDRIAGCSMGSFVAAHTAMGRAPEEVLRRCIEETVERRPMSAYTLPFFSLLRSQRAVEMLHRSFGGVLIEELPLEFYCVSCDLLSSALVVHRRGPLWRATGASMTLPAIFPPMPWGDRLLVDGGVLNNLPVEQMASCGEGPVIAVDVSAHFDAPAMRSRRGGWLRRARRALTGYEEPLPSIKETLIRSIVLGSEDTREAAEHGADLVIAPLTGPIPLTAWRQWERLVETGREAAREALASAPASLGR